MKQHIDLLGYVWIGWGIWQLIIAIGLGVVFGLLGGGLAVLGIGVGGDDGAGMALAGGMYGIIGVAVAIFAACMAIPSILVGGGLRRRAGWARLVAMILGALNLMNAPLGLILGIGTFIVLLDKDAAAEFGS